MYNVFNQSLNYSVSPEFGLFASLEDDQLGFMGAMEASMMKRKWVASDHYYYGQECTLMGSGPSRHFNQASLLIGRSKPFSSFRVKYQAGMAALWGIRHSRYFGLGTQLNVNLNTELPMIQLAICFSFGKLR